MELAVVVLVAVTCSAVMSIFAFMVGRCGRKLPIDGMLPRVVHSAQFGTGEDMTCPVRNQPGHDDTDRHRAGLNS